LKIFLLALLLLGLVALLTGNSVAFAKSSNFKDEWQGFLNNLGQILAITVVIILLIVYGTRTS